MKNLECDKCNYHWPTKSELAQVTCPNCGRKVIVKRCQVWDEKIKEQEVKK